MEWTGPEFVLAIIAISTVGWVLTTFIRARAGYPVENELGGLATREDRVPAARQVELLAGENAALKQQVGRLEERIAVVERILTDPARRVSDEIEALRLR